AVTSLTYASALPDPLLHSRPVFPTIAVLVPLGLVLLWPHKTDATTPQAGDKTAQKASIPAAHALDGQMIVWSGGRTEAEAQSQLQGFARYASALKDFIDVTPVVVESATVEGLKPGFFVVALGVCDENAVSFPVKIFQAIEPAVYTRQVHYK